MTATAPTKRAPATERSTELPKPIVKKRINVSLPVGIAEGLRSLADELGTYRVDVILLAHRLQGAAVVDAKTNSPGRQQVRKRRPGGRVQTALTIDPAILQQIDDDAKRCRLDRSAFVAELLERQIEAAGVSRKRPTR